MINIGGGKSSSRQRQTTNVGRASGAEDELQALQLNAMRQAAQPIAPSAIESLAEQKVLERLQGRAPVISPEAAKYLDEMFAYSSDLGTRNLTRAAEDMAARRGMRITDSPVGNEYLRSLTDLQRGLGASRAQSALDMGQQEAAYNANLQAFQNQLRQQAQMNRLQYGQTAGNMAQNLFGQRLAAAPRTATGAGTQIGAGGGMNLAPAVGAVANAIPWGSIGSGIASGARSIWNSLPSLGGSASYNSALRLGSGGPDWT